MCFVFMYVLVAFGDNPILAVYIRSFCFCDIQFRRLVPFFYRILVCSYLFKNNTCLFMPEEIFVNITKCFFNLKEKDICKY